MTTISSRRAFKGFTLPEILVTISIAALVGIVVFLVLNTGMTLYAKNTAVNSAHQQARSGVDQMLARLHSSVSIPQLVDANLQPVAEIGADGKPAAAAGISFQIFNAGPFPVVANADPTATSITLYCPGYTPPANARLNIPSHNIEYDISSTAAVGSSRQFNLSTSAGGIGTAVSIAGTGIEGQSGVTYMITAFITSRVSYAVIGSELRYFPTNNLANYRVITRNIVSQTPFTVPLGPDGQLQNQFIAAVNLSTVEPNFTKRGFAAVNMFISSSIPFRCRLTNNQ
jgi:prepilin-type N-terminal cleavage/methylation domain-containing protein